MAMSLQELQKAIAAAMPGPRRGDKVKLMMKEGRRILMATVESPGKIFTASKLGSKVRNEFASYGDFTVLKTGEGSDDGLYNAVCLKHPETGDIIFTYSQRFELQLDNKLFHGQPRVSLHALS